MKLPTLCALLFLLLQSPALADVGACLNDVAKTLEACSKDRVLCLSEADGAAWECVLDQSGDEQPLERGYDSCQKMIVGCLNNGAGDCPEGVEKKYAACLRELHP
jgi:hypothetical protein